MLKRILNCPERITFHRLSDVCDRRSAQVYAKIRLADVLPIEGSGLDQHLYEFALKAHYDFVVTDLSQRPLFAAEYDGPGHDDQIQAERDAKKAELSRRFHLPLLRIVAGDLHRSEQRLDRLTELAEQWFDERDRMSESRDCPLCGSGMLLKSGKYGPFLSCDRFPACRGACDPPGALTPAPAHPPATSGGILASLPMRWLVAAGVGILVVAMLGVIIANLAIDHGARVSSSKKEDPATIRQKNLLNLLIERRGWDAAGRADAMRRVLGYDREYTALTKQEATRLITNWDDRANAKK